MRNISIDYKREKICCQGRLVRITWELEIALSTSNWDSCQGIGQPLRFTLDFRHCLESVEGIRRNYWASESVFMLGLD